MAMRGRILIVDDDRNTCELLETSLKRRQFEVWWKTSAIDALEFLTENDLDAVVTDLNMPGMDGIEFCDRITANNPNLPVLVITAFGNLDTAVAAIRAGAYDFITKPFEIEELSLALDRAVQHRLLKAEVKRLRESAGIDSSDEVLLGESDVMKKLRGLIRRIADTDASVLITGETGTGKELVAKQLHICSRRGAGPFVAINCAAMPETLLESELFGHTRGAFTDARGEHAGLFVQADGGTLFLDEIGSMPLGLQPKLLRALQERRVRPVGSNVEIPFDVRIISATNADLESAVEDERFRQDLYYRINVLLVEVPPLRIRGSDVLLLSQRFILDAARRMTRGTRGLDSVAAQKLLAYEWPGNVRELQNCIERAVAMGTRDLLMVEDLPERIRNYRPSYLFLSGDDPRELLTMEELERRYILKVLEIVHGNRSEAARILGLDRRTLYRKLDRYDQQSP